MQMTSKGKRMRNYKKVEKKVREDPFAFEISWEVANKGKYLLSNGT